MTVAGVVAGEYIIKNEQSVKAITASELAQHPNSEIYASDGTTLLWTNGQYQHRNLTKKDTPQILKDLLTSTEDHTFYKNEGYSVEAIVNTGVSTVKDKLFHTSTARGGSTITQQLVKNIRYLDGKTDTYSRKVQEIVLAKKLSEKFSKEDILNAYLNKVGFLESSYGFQTAMYLLYGKEIKKDATSDDDIAHYATLVAMLKNPSIYNPRTNPEATEKRRNLVLKNALEQGKLTKKDYERIKAIPITKDLKDQGWFTSQVWNTASANGSYVNSIISQLKEEGYDLNDNRHSTKVVSNLDVAENEWLQNEVSKPEYYVNERQQVAVTVIDPKTGVVVAQSGSRNGASSTDLNRATQYTRSTGSTIKPFLDYSPLIEFSNVTENSTWNGNSTVYAGTNITVRNYGGYTYGRVTTRDALKLSLNVPAVEALQYQEPWMNQTIMKNLRVYDHRIDDNGYIQPVSTFGGSQALGINASTEDIASMFATYVNNGVYQKPAYVKSIEQDGVKVSLDQDVHQAVSPRTAYKILSMLKSTLVQGGSAQQAAIPEFAGYAAKTGTVGYDDNAPIYSDASHSTYLGPVGQLGINLLATDSWMSGATKSSAISVWTGFDDQSVYGDWIDATNQTRMDIFVSVMRHFNQGKDTSDFAASDEKVNLQKSDAVNQDFVTNESKVMSTKDLSLQPVTKNDVHSSKEQSDFYNTFYNTPDKLQDPYKLFQPWYIKNSSDYLSPALSQTETPYAKLYKINDSGTLTSE